MHYIYLIISLVIAISFHEASHALVAYIMGDPTAKLRGRVSLNPSKHLDLLGSMMILMTFISGFGIGWGKPVPINPYNFKNPRVGEALTAIAGPMANFFLAFIGATIYKAFYNTLSPSIINFLIIFILLNIGLMCFNLIPLPPLDGSKILFMILPDKYYQYRPMLESRGPIILLGIILVSQFLGIPVITFIVKPLISGVMYILGLNIFSA